MLESYLFQGTIDHINRTFHQAFLVGILYTQYKLTVHRFCNQIFV